MTIGIVGAGRMAQSLGYLLNSRGATVKGVASRTLASAETAASFIGSPARPFTLPQLFAETDHVILCVTDSALPAVAEQLQRNRFSHGCVLHTSAGAGLRPFERLSRSGVAIGVLHPLQTVPVPENGVADLPGAYFAIGGDAPAMQWASEIVTLLHGHALRIDADAWPFYHAAAVMASNYQCALMDSALELFVHAGIDRDSALAALGPMVRAAAQNISAIGPVDALTGPIARGDAGTVKMHLAALDATSPETRQLYVAAGLRTLPIAQKRGLPEAAAKTIYSTLNATHS
jgi:predicted short-subunit dehydrogenase-like oxidoreductase (DUF2520 family)